MLESARREYDSVGLLINLIRQPLDGLASMTLDEKVRLGMLSLAGASLVFASLGVHISPLDIVGGYGSH